MKKLAIPVYGGRISNRLDCSENIMLVTVENGIVKERETIRLALTNSLERINTLIELGADVLICNGITKFYSNKLKDSNIRVIPWVCGDVEETLSRYLEDELINQNTQKKRNPKKRIH